MRRALALAIATCSACCATNPPAEPQVDHVGEALHAKLKDFANHRNNVTISADEYVALIRDLPENVYREHAEQFVQPCVQRLGKELVGPLDNWLRTKDRRNWHRAFEILGYFVVAKVPFDPQLFDEVTLGGMNCAEHSTHYQAGSYFALQLTHSGNDGLKRLEETLSKESIRACPGYPALAIMAWIEAGHRLSGASLKHIADALILEPWHDYRDERSRSRIVFLNLAAGVKERLELEDLGSYEDMRKLWVKYRDYVHLRRLGVPTVTILSLDLSAFEAHTPIDPDTALPKR